MEMKKATIKMEFEFEEPDRWICNAKVLRGKEMLAAVLVYGRSIEHACKEAVIYIHYHLRSMLHDE